MISIDKKKKNNGSGNGNGSHGIALDKDKRRPLFHRSGKEKTQSYDYMDVLPAPVVVIDKEYTIKYANAAGAEALGRSKEDCIGQKCHDLFKFPLCNTPKCQACKVFADGNTYSSEVVIKTPQGDKFFRCYTIPVKDDGGIITAAMEYFIDATRELTLALEMGSVFGGVSLGKLEGRVDHTKFDGVLRKVAKGTNLCLDGLLGLHIGHHEYFVKISNGERNLPKWEQREETNHGVWKEQYKLFNEFIDGINGVMNEVDKLTKEAGEGNLAARGDASKFRGAWAEMINGINYVLDTVVTPINEVLTVMDDQSQMDLTSRVAGDYKGELANLKAAVNKSGDGQIAVVRMLKRMSRELIEAGEQLGQASEQANQSTNQISSASQQVANGASDQATSMQDTLKALEQLVRAIDQIARGAQEQATMIEKNVQIVSQVSSAITQVSSNTVNATTSARLAMDTAHKGAEMVQKTIKGMEEIKSTIEAASEKVSGLGTRSREIGKIVATINDIADQTNLLALNAAIEAARAGEQGRGFAVVADEVRKLAERASSSTEEIAELINGIQTGVSQTITAMEKGTEQIAGGYQLATSAGHSLEEILKQSREMGDQVEQISAASEQLNVMSSEMVKLSDNISAIVEENTAATEQMSATAKTVSKSVEEVAGVAEENSAATEQVSAASQEVGSQIQQVVKAGNKVTQVADEFKDTVAKYKLSEEQQ
ncbi:MAG: methyl-accepting chemotaxis protein [Dehalococcoidia bacterium]|jgi:methyl-accepting chemotaxis protein